MRFEKVKSLWDETRGERVRYGAAILALWFAILASILVPLVILVALDAMPGAGGAEGNSWLSELSAELTARHGPRRVLLAAACASVLLTSLSAALHYLRTRLSAKAAETIVRHLRIRLFEHLHRLPTAFLERADTGDLVQRCTSDVETLRVFLATQVVEIGRAVLLILTALPFAFWIDTRMGLVSMALHPIIAIFAFRFFRGIQDLFRQADEAEAAMTTALQENLTGIRVVRAYGREAEESARFEARNAEHRDRFATWISRLGTYWAVSDFLCVLQLGLVLFAGGTWLARGELTIGTFYAFIGLQGLVVWPLRQLGRTLSETGKALVAIERLAEILDEPEERRGEGTAEDLEAHLAFEGLSFAYDGKESILHNIDLVIQPGEAVALLGPPGAGKSTLLHLCLGLHDGYTGSIRLGGKELKDLSLETIRRHIGIVFQEPFLYSRSVLENLSLARENWTQEELDAAAEDADVHATFVGLKDGYATEIGERGVTLSGGQRQRLALARAFLEDAPVLFLDDALSAVDTDTEARILTALAARRSNRTTVLATHRLSVAPFVDRMVVFERGRIVQIGTPAELAAREGPYRELLRLQTEFEIPAIQKARP